ncbi:MAG TPA: DUF1643 domain-containing protein [Candidatus Paceibacterota bacterium]
MHWIYDRKKDNSARYTLSPRADNYLLCFGINPSTASPDKLDNTVKSVERIAKRHDFETFMMLNIYPQKATDPNGLHSHIDKKLHEKNIFYIEKYFRENKQKKILAAWGTLITKRPYLKECLRDIYNISKKYNCTWFHIGNPSLSGHPHHPLYLSNKEMMKNFDIDSYISKL